MPLNYTNPTAAALWVLAMYAVGFAIGVTSLGGWTVLTALALLPPLVVGRLWQADPSISERIHEVLR